MTSKRELTEDERSMLTTALHTAKGKYEELAKACREPEPNERLARQFDKQVRECLVLSDLIDGAATIEITPYVEEPKDPRDETSMNPDDGYSPSKEDL